MTWPQFDSQDEVPEAFRGQYEERDGKWQVKVEEPKPLGDGGKAAVEAERTARKAAEDRAKAAEAKAAELETKRKAESAGITDEKLQELRAQVRQDMEREYSEKPLADLPEAWAARKEADGVLGDIRTLRLDNQVKALAAKHGVRAEKLDQWWRLNSDRFDLTDDGKPMVKGTPGVEVQKFIEGELKKEVPEFYAGTQAAGGGAGGMQRDGKLIGGTSSDDVLKNPSAALNAARSGEAA